jgi:hypothetical protein
LHCPVDKEEACTLSGTNLFLIEAVASDSQFQHVKPISESAMDAMVDVPRPKGKLLYLKLRDDPSVVHTLEMPVKKDAPVVTKEAPSKEEKPTTAVHPRDKTPNLANLPADTPAQPEKDGSR